MSEQERPAKAGVFEEKWAAVDRAIRQSEAPDPARNWKAADYQSMYGLREGKIHIMQVSEYTMSRCGKSNMEMGGWWSDEAPTCKVCIKSRQGEIDRAEAAARYEAEAPERARRAAEFHAALRKEADDASRAWWDWYNQYLQTPKWKAKAAAVHRRARGICEACGIAPSTECHHVTYDHAGDEPLFDLRAVCRPCHERITEIDRRRRAGGG